MDLIPGLASLGALVRELNLPTAVLSPLLAHAEAVRESADRLGLVAAGDADSILARHTADSLLFALARPPHPDEAWVDVGAGAGFPGLVLAIAYHGTRFTLVEPQQRRAGFLELQLTNLGLANCEVFGGRAEDLTGAFDVGTARALADPSVAASQVLSLLRPGGTALIALGADAEPPKGTVLALARAGVDSPGRLLMMARPTGGG